MASTRASSPGSTPSSPTQLTPRSKVKAMLAAMDDDSDEDDATALSKPRSTSLFTNIPKPTRQGSVDDVHQDAANGEDTEEEEEDDISKPRGRMAARMHAAQESDHESQAYDARERVRKMLAKESKKTKEPSPDAEIQNDSSDDGDVQVASRKRRAQKLRTPTPDPESITRNSESPGGLFVSPASEKRSSPNASDSDDDLPQNLGSDARFQALVQKKREERKAKEAELEKEKAEKIAKRKNFSKMIDQDEELDVSDSETEQRLTQPVRTGRKASKRALEEMKRETQRMSRNMQLAHEARTKKKITKASLFAKFNYRQSDSANVEAETRPASSSSALQSESETRETTPPTSPSLAANETSKALRTPITKPTHLPPVQDLESDEVVMSLEDVLAQASKNINKDKGKAPQDVPSSPPNLEQPHKNHLAQKHNRKDMTRQPAVQEDSDSDLEITYSTPRAKSRKEKLKAIFDRVPARQAQESHSLQTLRLLAHLSSPGKTNKNKNTKPSMTNTELQMTLQQRIRQQAARERAEREQALRDRGITVLTAEEREKEMVDVEDLIAKARREADEITKKEKDEAKRERKENGEIDPLGDSSDDEDWQQEDKEPVEEQLSGSGSENELYDGPEDVGGEDSGEEEGDEDAMTEDGEGDEQTNNEMTALFDNEASETESEAETRQDAPDENEIAQASDQEEDEDEALPAAPTRRRTKNTNIISDDEEEPTIRPMDRTPAVKHFGSPMPPKTISPIAPNSVLRSATKTFIPGVTVAGPAGLGLTQIFQGTMDDSQPQLYSDTTVVPETSSGGDGQDSMAFLRRMPPPIFPAFESTVEEESEDIIMDSQPDVSQVPASQPLDEVSQPLQLEFSQSQIHGFDSLVQDPFASQYSELPEQTQDVGFQTQSPIKNRFVSQSQGPPSTMPQSTVDTVIIEHMIPEEGGDSPTVKKLGRLHRRNQIQRQLDEEEAGAANETNPEDDEGFDISANAFDVMRKAAKKKKVVEDFDKNKSKAKEMVHEQAEESEDEYAGLGGASDDESGGEDDALVKAMIDDEAGKEADERQLAAFFADKERAKDSKAVEKLFKDITNGMLRRKRGGDYSLSDSEDDGEARRNQKRKEFARMRKALLEDERIGKIAQNPKQSAFLAAIEDREKDDEIDFLDTFEDSQEVFESQGESQGKDTEMTDGVQVPGSQPDTSMGPPKRKRGDDTSDIENRPPPNLRRTKGNKRPSNLSEIRESLSSLIEEPNSNLDVDDSDSESDLEIIDPDDEDGSGSGTDKEPRRRDAVERDPFAARRNASVAVVDRISLKRSSSSNISANTKFAFAAPTTSLYNVKVPPLLRKATSNLSTTSSSSGISGMGKGALEAAGLSNTGIKRGGSRTSGIAYQARETERRKAVEEGEKRREKRKFKGAERRREAVGGLFGKGSFE